LFQVFSHNYKKSETWTLFRPSPDCLPCETASPSLQSPSSVRNFPASPSRDPGTNHAWSQLSSVLSLPSPLALWQSQVWNYARAPPHVADAAVSCTVSLDIDSTVQSIWNLILNICTKLRVNISKLIVHSLFLFRHGFVLKVNTSHSFVCISRWKYDGPSYSFKALIDMAAVHSSCRLCIHIDTNIHEKEERTPKLTNHPCSCSSKKGTVYHLFIWEGRFKSESICMRYGNFTIVLTIYLWDLTPTKSLI